VTGVRRLLDCVMGTLCSVLLGVLVLVLTWQVVSRYALNSPSTFSEEALRFGLVWLSLLGAAYAAGRGNHMSVELLREMASGRIRRMMEYLVPISFILFAAGVMIPGGLKAMEIASTQSTAVLRLPMSIVYAALPVSGVLIILYSLLNMFDLWTGEALREDTVEHAMASGD